MSKKPPLKKRGPYQKDTPESVIHSITESVRLSAAIEGRNISDQQWHSIKAMAEQVRVDKM